FQKVGHLVGETVFVANLKSRHPPMAHVGVVAVRNVDGAPASSRPLVAVVEVLKTMQIVQVPGYRGVFAVDFKSVESLVAAGIAGRLESGQRAIGEMAHEGAGIVDAHLLDLAGQIML